MIYDKAQLDMFEKQLEEFGLPGAAAAIKALRADLKQLTTYKPDRRIKVRDRRNYQRRLG